jgi:MmyB-like transcription regulator ligand binding domain
VKSREGGVSLLRHPEVGDLTLRREKLAVGGTGGQLLVVYYAEPGSETEGLLALLGSISSKPGRDQHDAQSVAPQAG